MTGPDGAEDRRRAVLLLNNPFLGDSRSWKMARSLADGGWTVTVVARTADGVPEREERDGFAIVRIDQPRPLAWLPTPRLPDAATGESSHPTRSRVATLRATATEIVGRPVQAIRYLRLASEWAARIGRVVPGADIWQAEGMITLPVALALRRRFGGRVVYDARDLQVESSRFARLPAPWRRLLARRERGWARAADATVTVNRPYAEVVERRLGVRPTIVFNGPTDVGGARQVPIRERLGLGPSVRIVLCLGNVAPGRGVRQLCRAIADVPDAVLLVVGPGGEYREQLRRSASQLPGADRIHFLPEVAPADIPAWTAAADVAAMTIQPTTLNHRLTTPTRLFDALGAGIPIVASDLPGMAEIVRQTGAGVVCDPNDPAAIAQALREVLDAPPERRAAFRAAALVAGERYAWDRQIATLLGVYREMLPA